MRTTSIGEQRMLHNLDRAESSNPVMLFGFALEPIPRVTWVVDMLRVRTFGDVMGTLLGSALKGERVFPALRPRLQSRKFSLVDTIPLPHFGSGLMIRKVR